MLKIIGNKPIVSEVYSDKNGLLYDVNNGEYFSKQDPIIVYINGSQLDHYKKNGNGKGLFMPGQKSWGHNYDWYTNNLKPYIFKYRVNNSKDNSHNFSKSLYKALKTLETDKIILIGKSYGGIIASRLDSKDIIKKIIAVNPDLLGSPLADYNLFLKYYDYSTNLLKRLVWVSQILTFNKELKKDNQIEFTLEKSKGLFIEELKSLKKTIVFGGSVNHLNPKNIMEGLLQISAKVIFDMVGKNNNGTVIFEKNTYNDLNLEVIDLPRPYHFNTQESFYNYLIMLKMQEILNII